MAPHTRSARPARQAAILHRLKQLAAVPRAGYGQRKRRQARTCGYTESFTFAVGFALAEVQGAINVACNEPEGESNGDLSAANWAWILLGALFWLLIVLGLYGIWSGTPA